MMHRLSICLLVSCLAAFPCAAGETVHVPAADVVAVARDALLARASAAGVRLDLRLAAQVGDIELPVAVPVTPQVTVGQWQGAWLRSRVGVPVQVKAGDRRTVAMVWFAVSAPAPGQVYADGFARGAAAETLSWRPAQVDLAKWQGAAVTVDPASLSGQRLRRAVRAGDAVLASDFEPVPAVSARQTVDVLATRGAVTLSVRGRALNDGDAGQLISVLPANATSPIRARVVSSGVVSLEN